VDIVCIEFFFRGFAELSPFINPSSYFLFFSNSMMINPSSSPFLLFSFRFQFFNGVLSLMRVKWVLLNTISVMCGTALLVGKRNPRSSADRAAPMVS
jgi:hypothetical protein